MRASELPSRFASPLEELKALLKRTSHVEEALQSIEKDTTFPSPEETSNARSGPKSLAWQQRQNFLMEDDEDAEAKEFRGLVPKLSIEPTASSKTSQPLTNIPQRTTQRNRMQTATQVLTKSGTIPKTPLAMSMAKLQQAEEHAQRDRVQARREIDAQKKKASSLLHRFSQLQALHKHLGTEVRGLKGAVNQRDAKIQQLEERLQNEHDAASMSIDSFNQQINLLKEERVQLQGLLSAALQQIQDTGRHPASNARPRSPASANKPKAAFKYLNAKVVAERLVRALTKDKGEAEKKGPQSADSRDTQRSKDDRKPPKTIHFEDAHGMVHDSLSPPQMSVEGPGRDEAELYSKSYQDEKKLWSGIQVDPKLNPPVHTDTVLKASSEMGYVDRFIHDEGYKVSDGYEVEPLEAKAKALEEQAAMLGTGNKLSDVLIRTLVEGQGEYNAFEIHTDELEKEFQKHIQEKRELALQMAAELRDRVEERLLAQEALQQLRAEMDEKLQKLERDKAEFHRQMQEGIEENDEQWMERLEKLKTKEKRMSERLKDIAEEKIDLQKEVSSLTMKKNSLLEEARELQNAVKDLKQQLDESGQENMKLRKALEASTRLLEASREGSTIEGSFTKAMEDSSIKILGSNFAKAVDSSIIRVVEGLPVKSLTEDEWNTLTRKYRLKEKELSEKLKAVTKLQRLCKEQEKTIQGLRLALGDHADSGKLGKGEFLIKLQSELIRLTGLEQSLRKESEAYKAEARAAKQENARLIEKLGLAMRKVGNSGSITMVDYSMNLGDNHRDVAKGENKVVQNHQLDRNEDGQNMALVLMAHTRDGTLKDTEATYGEADDLREEVAMLFHTRTRLQKEAENLHSALTLTNRRVRELEAQLAGKDQELGGIQEELERVREQRDAMQREADFMGREAIRLSTQVEQLSKKVEKLDEDVMLKDGQLSILRGALQQESD